MYIKLAIDIKYRQAMDVLKYIFVLMAICARHLVLGESNEEAFKKNQVVPDVIPKAPHYVIQVVYPSGVRVNKGNKLTPLQVKDEPSVSFKSDPKKYYTLAMVDPDIPSRNNSYLGQFLHWLVGNIKGDYVMGGDDLAAYMGSAPPNGTGYHRYVFLAYKQPGRIDFDGPRLNNTSEANRTKFSIYDFSKKYSFGDPVGGNFFFAQYDAYVDIRTAQLNGQ